MHIFPEALTARLSRSVNVRIVPAAFVFVLVIFALFQDGGRTVKADTTIGGRTQHLTSPSDVPDGLAPSEWGSIREAHESWRAAMSLAAIGQEAYLKPAAVGTTQANDWFGQSVAVSGDTVVVGALLEGSSTTGVNTTPNEAVSSAGAAYVFTRSGGVWTQQAYLKPAAVGTTQAGDQFGRSVAVSGDTVVVGAFGEDSSTTGVNTTPNEAALSAGAAYVFTRSGTTWTQQAYLKPAAAGTTQAGDLFGASVAVSGDTVVVGAYQEDSSTTGVNTTPDEAASNAGAAYVFTRSGTTWTQQAYLKPAAAGSTQAGDFFGISVAVSGDTAVVGAMNEDSSALAVNTPPDELSTNAGAAYVFTRGGTTWTQQAYLKPAAVGTTQAGDIFGISVDVSGDTAVVGAYAEDSSTTGVNTTPDESSSDSGAAYVFTRSGTTWTQQAYLKAATVGTTQAGDLFGQSVAVSGDTVVVGAFFEDSSTTGVNPTPDEAASSAGAAYVFTRSGTTWTQQAYLKPSAVGTTQVNDQFSISLDVSGDTVVVGARFEDSSTLGVNTTPNESAPDSGAAYVFTGLSPTAAGVSVSGRVTTADGRGLRKAIVVMTDMEGNLRRASTNSAGYYRFDNVAAGSTFVANVSIRGYTFTPRVVQVFDSLTGVDFAPK